MNIKLFSAALAVAALASCSNDDFTSNSASAPITKTMNVTVEEMQGEEAGTRAAYYATSEKKNAFRFLEGDEINVYDDNLAAYDVFALGADSKWATTTSNVTEHKFGVYPATRWENHGWTPDGLRASVMIPRAVNAAATTVQASYSTAKESVTVGATTYDGYTSNIPVWGATTDDPTNVLNMDMKYLTGVLKISLSKVSDATANWIKVSSAATDAPISGYFYAILKAGTTPELTVVDDNEALENYYDNGHDIIVSLPGGTTAYDYCVYVPIISGVEFSQLTVSYGYEATGNLNPTQPATVTWTPIYTYTNKTFERGKIYASGLSARFYSDDSMEPQNVNDAATLAAESNLDIILKATNLNVDVSASQAGKHTIDLPATAKNITLDFANIKKTSDAPTLTIQGANFTGDFTLKNGAASEVPIVVNLPKANKVTLAGTYASAATDALTIQEAKTLVFGDGSTTTTANAANLTLTKVTAGIEVAHAATIAGTLDLSVLPNVQVPVTIGGSMENLTTKKSVNVATIAESEAISGALTFPTGTAAADAKVTLKQGLINSIVVADAVDATLVNPEGQGIAAIKTVNTNTTGTLTTSGVSKWNGKYIATATYATTNITNIWTASQFASWANKQTGYNTTASDGTLRADIDMDNQDRTGVTLSNNLTGFGDGYTIKNIGNKNATTGLFNSPAAAALTVSNITLDGVKIIKKAQPSIGALFMSVAQNITIDKVIVKNAELGGVVPAGNTTDFVNIGGLIGTAKGNITITDCKVAGTIKGYKNLGGFVGTYEDNTAATPAKTLAFTGSCESDVAFTFSKTYTNTVATDAALYAYSNVQNATIIYDKACGTIGSYVGGIDYSDGVAAPATTQWGVVNIGDKCVDKCTLDKKALGFNNNWSEENSGVTGVFSQYFFKGVTNLIGYSANFKSVSFWKDRVQQTYDGTNVDPLSTLQGFWKFNAYSQTAN